MARIHKNDMVEVISGNDRGKRGRVLRVLVSRDRFLVEGVNVRWKHMRKSQQMPQGGRVKKEAPIHRSNVMLFDEAAGVRTRVGYRIEDGKKIRIARRGGGVIGGASASGSKASGAKAAGTSLPKQPKAKPPKKTAAESAAKTKAKAKAKPKAKGAED